ncbi:hypothetical protein RFH42_09445 [Acinetobacter rudis]|uniref:hypothetical protein n=1 Tax=Acinetobacter rudis TaxID=632955 RepID=UPI00280F4712|nr:hypothetical protein [Acinetobacter rudis]MDQ8953182.1 hypothetical protein [Acinetobacter rudis]
MDVNTINRAIKITEAVQLCLIEELSQISNHERYPDGCCEIASSILLSILRQEGIREFSLIKGEHPRYIFHFWLESESHVIDLTAHQFDGIEEPFIMLDKDLYTLSQEGYFSDRRNSDIDNTWSYLTDVMVRFEKIFYEKYYEA